MIAISPFVLRWHNKIQSCKFVLLKKSVVYEIHIEIQFSIISFLRIRVLHMRTALLYLLCYYYIYIGRVPSLKHYLLQENIPLLVCCVDSLTYNLLFILLQYYIEGYRSLLKLQTLQCLLRIRLQFRMFGLNWFLE